MQRDDDLTLLTVIAELLGVVGAGVPDDHLAAAVLALRYRALEAAVLQWMVFGVDRQVIDRGSVGQVLRHGPRHQHAVAFEPEVVMQSASVMLLDHEGITVTGSRFGARYRLRCLRRVAHAAVFGQPIGGPHVGVPRPHEISVALDPLAPFVVAKLAQLLVVELLPASWRR